MEVLRTLTPWQLAVRLGALLVTFWVVKKIVLMLFGAFHGPLAKVPGPFLPRLSGLPILKYAVKGTHFLYLQSLHKKYGNIVRFGELRFIPAVNKRNLQTLLLLLRKIFDFPFYVSSTKKHVINAD